MKNYLPQNLKYLRTQKRLTQEQLGKELGKGATAITNYESGYRTPHGEDLRALANYFHVSVDRLLGEDLSYVTDGDAQLKADWIHEELLRMRLSDKEFDMIESYIEFVLSQRNK